MAKYMAHLQENTVENILWCSDRQLQTQDLVDCGGCAVQIGDTFMQGCFYRNGEKLLTEVEEVEQEYLQEISSLVEIIYQMDMEVIG